MNWITLLPTLVQLVSEIPAIRTAWETNTSGGMAAVAAVVQKTGVADELATIGAALFPKLSSALHAAAAALVIAHPNNTSWVQSAINVLNGTGYIRLAKPLVVDGKFGPMTMAAVEALQIKLGIPVTGFVADFEYNALSGLLSKV